MPLAAPSFPAPLAEPDAAAGFDAETTDEVAEAGLPRIVYGLVGALAVLGLLTPNGLLTAASFLVLGLLVRLLWRPGEPPVLLFAVGYQWAQVTAKLFHANVLGVYVEQLSASERIVEATWLSLIGLIVLSVGMWLVLRRLPPVGARLRAGLDGVTVTRAFWLYVGTAIFAALIVPLGWALGPLTQILLSTAGIKWAGYFLLAYLALSRREGLPLLALAFAIELLSGIGYFAGFKTVLFVTLLAALATRPRITAGTVLGSVAAVVVLIAVGAAWSAIKPSFRAEIGIEGRQGAAVGQGEQVAQLVDAVSGLTADDLLGGLDPLFSRLAYTEYFGLAMDYVPVEVPHERGALWGTAVKHVLQPRLFFPDKPRLLSDSEVTTRYTGQRLASDAEGTSISLGYMGESYVDFGRIGMFGVVLALGLLWGWMFRYFVRSARVPLLGLAVALAVLQSAYQFEMASIKLLGGVLMSFLVLALALRLFESGVASWLGVEVEPEKAQPDDAPEPPLGVGGWVRV